MDEQEHMQRVALEECSVSFVNKVDVTTILPHLIKYHLLTHDDRQVLMMGARTQVEKAQYLLDILPRKAKGWFEVFLECLRETADGTGHGDLVEDLEAKFAELNEQRKNRKKVFRLGGRPSSVEKTQRPVGGGQIDEYTIFLESSGTHSTHTFRVRSTDTVDSLLKKVCKRLNIGHFHGVKLIAGSRELVSEKSLEDSGVNKNSRVAMVVTTHGGLLIRIQTAATFIHYLCKYKAY